VPELAFEPQKTRMLQRLEDVAPGSQILGHIKSNLRAQGPKGSFKPKPSPKTRHSMCRLFSKK